MLLVSRVHAVIDAISHVHAYLISHMYIQRMTHHISPVHAARHRIGLGYLRLEARALETF